MSSANARPGESLAFAVAISESLNPQKAPNNALQSTSATPRLGSVRAAQPGSLGQQAPRMSDNKLILVPDTPEDAPPSAQVIEAALRDVGLIGEATDHFGATHYRAGPRFHELVRFERSHPVVHLRHGPEGLQPDGVSDSRTLCTVELPAPTADVQWLGGADAEDPSCRRCGHSLRDW